MISAGYFHFSPFVFYQVVGKSTGRDSSLVRNVKTGRRKSIGSLCWLITPSAPHRGCSLVSM